MLSAFGVDHGAIAKALEEDGPRTLSRSGSTFRRAQALHESTKNPKIARRLRSVGKPADTRNDLVMGPRTDARSDYRRQVGGKIQRATTRMQARDSHASDATRRQWESLLQRKHDPLFDKPRKAYSAGAPLKVSTPKAVARLARFR